MANSDDLGKFYWRLGAIIGGGIVLALAVFMGIIPAVEGASKPAYLDVLVLPAEAKVEINGQEYNNAVYEMEPGKYTAEVKMGDLTPEVVQLNLEKNRTMGLYMDWSETGGWRYYTAEELKHKNSIEEILPIYTSVCGAPAKRTNCDAISVSYDRVPQCGNAKCLVINGRQEMLTDEVLTEVRNKLSENGYNLDDYKYVYVQNDER